MKRLISIFTMICMILTVGCFSASAADMTDKENLSTSNCSSNVVIGDSVEITVEDANETTFETHDEDGAELSISPRVTVPNGCESCIKRIIVWPAHYDSANKTIRYSKEIYAFYTWEEATSFGGTLEVPTQDTANLMNAFTKGTGFIANAWRMEVTFNIYSDYYGSYPKYYEFKPATNSLADTYANGMIRFECNGQPGHQTVYLTSSFSAPTDPSNQPALVLDGAFYYYDKTTKRTQGSMSFAQTLFNR